VSLKPVNGEAYSIQHHVIKFLSDLRQVGGFLQVLPFPPRYNWNIVESGVKHNKHYLSFVNLFQILLNSLVNRLLCERQWALYGIKCVLRIFWQIWLCTYWRIKKNWRFINTFRVTHSTNEDLLNIKRKGDPEVLYPLSYVRYHWNPEPVCNKSYFVSLFYLYWYFLIY
jgi:hypothetical protein